MNTKLSISSLILLLLASFSAAPSFADEAKTAPLANELSQSEIPTAEKAFVAAINKYDKKAIVAQLGEPAKADDVRLKGSDTVVASIWQYHNINTAEDGSYYETTELDFVDDKVVQVVFLNNDGSEKDDGQKYEIGTGAPENVPNDALGDGVPMIDMGK